PRTARWMVDEVRSRADDVLPGRPETRITPGLLGHVALDESIMAMAVGPNRYPRRDDYVRVGRELTEARAVLDAGGWLDDPAAYHRAPPALEEPVRTTGWALGTGYERLWWPSGFVPREGLPGADRWSAFEANRTASAWLLRHPDRDRPRPWVVCIHGFGTGSVFMDLLGFRAAHLHRALGVNVAAIVLPAHGARRTSRISGEDFLGFDLVNSLHGLTQAVWDVRRLLTWVRAQSPTRVGVFGVSLGGMLTALVAALEDDLDLALAGIPMADFPDLIRHHSPHHLHLRAIEHHILDGTAQDVHRVVSPLCLPPAAPVESRAVFAGLGDRLATADQARRLWDHWERPEMCWFPGSHVGYLWSDKAWRFVDDRLAARGFVADAP
ncbi:MAG: alpha/beta hydrolase, partial [Acidimicrobiales bacterium]|nr:alpha/beta hydrolase [Acidimicrobiales bacterium]